MLGLESFWIFSEGLGFKDFGLGGRFWDLSEDFGSGSLRFA